MGGNDENRLSIFVRGDVDSVPTGFILQVDFTKSIGYRLL
jgi:hypothetical protein